MVSRYVSLAIWLTLIMEWQWWIGAHLIFSLLPMHYRITVFFLHIFTRRTECHVSRTSIVSSGINIPSPMFIPSLLRIIWWSASIKKITSVTKLHGNETQWRDKRREERWEYKTESIKHSPSVHPLGIHMRTTEWNWTHEMHISEDSLFTFHVFTLWIERLLITLTNEILSLYSGKLLNYSIHFVCPLSMLLPHHVPCEWKSR